MLAADTAIEVTNDALQVWGAAGYSRDNPMERFVRDARMFAIAGGTAQVLRTQVAEQILGRKLPQTRDGFLRQGGGRRRNKPGGFEFRSEHQRCPERFTVVRWRFRDVG